MSLLLMCVALFDTFHCVEWGIPEPKALNIELIVSTNCLVVELSYFFLLVSSSYFHFIQATRLMVLLLFYMFLC